MNYEQVRQLKEKVEVFENTSFVSVLSANELLLLNEKTGDTWSVEYSYEEDALVLHGDTAVCVEHNSTVDEEDENLSLEKVNEALLLSYSDNNKSAFSEGLSYLPQLIAERKKSKPKSTEHSCTLRTTKDTLKKQKTLLKSSTTSGQTSKVK